jgi:hypothetical protein
VTRARGPWRPSGDPLSLAVARVLLGSYLCWKVASFPWGVLGEWPVRYAETYAWAAPGWLLRVLPVEASLAVAASLAVVVGYRLRVAALAAALLATHLGMVLLTLSPSGGVKSLFVAALLLVGVALYADTDRLTVDALRRTTAADLRDGAVGRSPGGFPRFATLVVATTYFGAGVSKAVSGPLLAWTAPRSLGTYLLYAGDAFGTPTPVSPALVSLLLATPPLLAAMAWATILLEVGFLPAALARRPVWPFVVGLAGLHAGIAVAMGPLFVDQVCFLAMLLPWGGLYAAAVDRTPLSATVDARDVRSLRLLRALSLVDGDRLRVHVRTPTTDGGAGRERAAAGEGDDPPAPLELRAGGEQFRGGAARAELRRRFPRPRRPGRWWPGPRRPGR